MVGPPNWEMQSFVLKTCSLFESHTRIKIADVLKLAVAEWEHAKPNHAIAVVTDNAQTKEAAIQEANLAPHIKYFPTLPHEPVNMFPESAVYLAN